MTNTITAQSHTKESMLQALERQRQVFLKNNGVSYEIRVDRLKRATALLVENADKIAETIAADYGCRHNDFSRFADVTAAVLQLKNAGKHLKSWMKPERRKPDFQAGWLGAKARVHHVPKGVVGIISPWNFPIFLIFGPMAGALAAGNSIMIKPSEYTANTSALVAELIAKYFDETEAAVFTGGTEVGQAFSGLPFDHLIYTGGTKVAKLVMKAAAENLVPLTLELGGKSPVIVGRSAHMDKAAERIVVGKMMNAGQVCLAPDYIFVPEENIDEFINLVKRHALSMYPRLKENPDFTSIVNENHFNRLKNYLDDAKSKGAHIEEFNPSSEDFSDSTLRKLPLTIITNPSDDLLVMQEELFGPIMPIKSYKTIYDVIDYINARPRPLCLYYFGRDKNERNTVLTRTTSGGATVNDVITHALMENLPFGGVGFSGMGNYHGIDGFKTFSHAKSIFTSPRTNLWKLMGMQPPYGNRLKKILKLFIR
jgi:coniferyl-aldehyde dehydrogenase